MFMFIISIDYKADFEFIDPLIDEHLALYIVPTTPKMNLL